MADGMNLVRLPESQAFGIFGERWVRRACPSLWVTNPMVGEDRPKRKGDGTAPRHCRGKHHLRREHSRLHANSPIGRASGSDASRVRSRLAPDRQTARREARSRWVWAEGVPPVPTRPPVLPRLRMQELLRAY